VKQVYHIDSERNTETTQQILSIRIGERHFGFAITSADAGELFKLTWYTGTEIDEPALKDLYQKHTELQQDIPACIHLLRLSAKRIGAFKSL
jgi:hypothetical protein